MDKSVRKPALKPLSVSPYLRVLRVNRPEATFGRHAPRRRGYFAHRAHLQNPTILRICDGNVAGSREAHSFLAPSVTPEGRFCVFCGKKDSPFPVPFPVDKVWVKSRASQPHNHSPCPRASARSVLTGRRLKHSACWGRACPPSLSQQVATLPRSDATRRGWRGYFARHPTYAIPGFERHRSEAKSHNLSSPQLGHRIH